MNIDWLTELWDEQPGEFFCLATKGARWQDYFFVRDDFDTLAQWVEKRMGENVYFCPHSFKSRRRSSEHYAGPSRMLWADLDRVDPRTLAHRPTVAWCTSPGRYAAIWRLDREPTRELRRGFNDMLGADAGWHLTKVLRLPGTRNRKPKYSPAPMVRLLWTDGPAYRVASLNKYAASDDGGGESVDGFEVNIDGLSGEAVCAKYKWDTFAMRMKVDKGEDRSLHCWDLGRLFKRLGATPDEIGAVIWDSTAWKDRTQHMSTRAALQALSKEVWRVMTKK